MNYEISSLNNGLRIVTDEMPHMESVSIGLWVLCGGRYEEEKGIGGISHFLEHMLFKGTKKKKSKEISEAIEGIGGVLNAFTSEESTCYFAKVPKKHFLLSLEVLADMYLNSTLIKEEIAKEKGIIKEEIRMYLDLPSQYVHDVLNGIIWPKHPLGRLLLGTAQSIDNLSRENLFSYKEKHYIGRKTVVAVAGNVSHKMVVNEVEKLFAGLPEKKSKKFVPARERQTSPQALVLRKKTEQAHLCLGIRALSKEHPDRYILRLMNTILGGNMSSRLFQEVREKNSLAYEINSAINSYTDTGCLVVSAGVERNNLKAVIEIIMQELKKFTAENVSLDELQRAKDYVEGHMMMSLEKTMNSMFKIGEALLTTGKILTKKEIVESLRRVTQDDIKRLAKELFKNKSLNLAIIGPVKKEEKIEKTLCL